MNSNTIPPDSVCVYCGSRDGERPAYREAAIALGSAIGLAGLRLVYGGAQVGLMGALADAALAAGAPVLGVMPEHLSARELAHPQLTTLKVVDTMHQRKLAMVEAADAFVALPGGFGTLDELFEVLTWRQLGHHDKPSGLLEVDGFYQPLLACMQHMQTAGFVTSEQVARIQVSSEPMALLARLGLAEAVSAPR